MKKILVLAIALVLCASFSLSSLAVGDTIDEHSNGVNDTSSKTESSATEIIDDSEILNSNIEIDGDSKGLGVWLWVIIGAAVVVVVIVVVMLAKKK